ncbi:hypothetical protein [Saccharopolyspora mangrovi]|uniref:AbrB/MazE/SpoVT family DNA-binding domain-containing protein n=1 Tax=Saccharopolyspora mangrovi TaxID=3082379 RepID=A0ABU6AIP7_9PSEU|nr:hypothetical protein [Saccharopolyspora sp. S2-29]MEB3371323.1 hypothetical protein [Saccharopolyspora sp. S2-29]
MDWGDRFNWDERADPTGWTETIVAAVLPDRRPDAELEIPPLPVPELGPVADGSSAFSMGRIDRSGRIAARSVLDRLSWSPHDRLSLTTVAGIVVIRRDPADGTVTLPGRGCLGIPSRVRGRCGIEPGRSVLLTAMPSHDLVLLYPEAMVEQMLLLFHTQVIAQD